jgi:arginase family enzyme
MGRGREDMERRALDSRIVCVPYQTDIGKWGCARGPEALLEAGLGRRLEAAGHHVSEPVWVELAREERTRDTVTNLAHIAAHTADAVRDALEAGADLVLALQGNCTHSPGPMGGLAQVLGEAPGVVWFDAHGDLNTRETSDTGCWGGMPYAVALGWDLDDWREAAGLESAVRPEAAALIGGSDLDGAEVEAIERHGIARLDAAEMQEGEVAERLRNLLASRRKAAPGWYLHVDLDVAGPDEAPGGMTPAPLWPTRETLVEAVAVVPSVVPVRVAGIAVYTPDADPDGRGARFALDITSAIVEAQAMTTTSGSGRMV